MADLQRKTANLFDKTAEYTVGATTYDYTISGLDPNKYYTCSTNFERISGVDTASIYFGGGRSDINGVWSGTQKTFKPDSNGEIIVYIRYSASAGAPPIIDDVMAGTIWVMVNEGSTPLPYEPYGWVHSLRKLTTSTDTLTTLPVDVYADGNNATVSISGNTVQNGTPTPDNPIMPQECGDMSSNLFDLTAYYAKDSGVSNIVTTQNSITYNASSVYCAIRYELSIAQNETMKLSFGSATGNGRLEIRYYNTQTGQQVGDTITVLQNERITLTGSSEYDSVRIYLSNGTTTGTMSFSDIMINIGTTFLPFEPYGQYKIPISSADTTTPVYLVKVETERKIKKLVLDGTEDWSAKQTGEYKNFSLSLGANGIRTLEEKSTHFQCIRITEAGNTDVGFCIIASGLELRIRPENVSTTSLNDFISYLQQQYAAGTPVTVWYVLAEPETGIVNEPLMKIGDYADTVSGITIPTITGKDTFDVDTTLKPSKVSLSYTGWHDATVEEWDGSDWS